MYKYFVLLRLTYPFPGTMTHNIYTTTPETAQLPSLVSIPEWERVGLDVHFMLNTITTDSYMMDYNKEKRKI